MDALGEFLLPGKVLLGVLPQPGLKPPRAYRSARPQSKRRQREAASERAGAEAAAPRQSGLSLALKGVFAAELGSLGALRLERSGWSGATDCRGEGKRAAPGPPTHPRLSHLPSERRRVRSLQEEPLLKCQPRGTKFCANQLLQALKEEEEEEAANTHRQPSQLTNPPSSPSFPRPITSLATHHPSNPPANQLASFSFSRFTRSRSFSNAAGTPDGSAKATSLLCLCTEV
ncbi:hypothetical protein E2320_021690 [Naja naja]|nr:hypothetical protein E2320_021690 [Naja naja]